MNYDNIVINDKQAEKFAIGIYNDIASYLKEHQQEYNKWLKESEANKNEETE